jgi:TonB family protein
VSVPQIDVPELVIPRNNSADNPSPQLTPQQLSALASYSARLRARIDAAWVKPEQLAGVQLVAEVIFDVSPSGQITNVRLRRSSGNNAFDQSILSAYRRVTSAGPTPTGDSHQFTLAFRMRD